MPESCGDLLDTAAIADLTGNAWVLAPAGEVPELPGPLAQVAAAEATQRLDCLWNPDPGFGVYIWMHAFRLESISGEALLDGLRQADSYAPVEVDGSEAYVTTELRGDLAFRFVYAFVDDLWIALQAPLYDEDALTLMGEAVSNVRSAAP